MKCVSTSFYDAFWTSDIDASGTLYKVKTVQISDKLQFTHGNKLIETLWKTLKRVDLNAVRQQAMIESTLKKELKS